MGTKPQFQCSLPKTKLSDNYFCIFDPQLKFASFIGAPGKLAPQSKAEEKVTFLILRKQKRLNWPTSRRNSLNVINNGASEKIWHQADCLWQQKVFDSTVKKGPYIWHPGVVGTISQYLIAIWCLECEISSLFKKSYWLPVPNPGNGHVIEINGIKKSKQSISSNFHDFRLLVTLFVLADGATSPHSVSEGI